MPLKKNPGFNQDLHSILNYCVCLVSFHLEQSPYLCLLLLLFHDIGIIEESKQTVLKMSRNLGFSNLIQAKCFGARTHYKGVAPSCACQGVRRHAHHVCLSH